MQPIKDQDPIYIDLLSANAPRNECRGFVNKVVVIGVPISQLESLVRNNTIRIYTQPKKRYL